MVNTNIRNKKQSEFHKALSLIDKSPPQKMNSSDAERIVQFHQFDYVEGWELVISESRGSIKAAAEFLGVKSSFTTHHISAMEKHTKVLEVILDQLGQVSGLINSDIKVMRRYSSFLGKLLQKFGV